MPKIILAILDGVGIRNEKIGNAVTLAKTPTLDYLLKTYPHSKLEASGKYVGLPEGQMGNSEVGHLTIGAGRVVLEPLEKINQSIKNNELKNNKVLKEAINHSKINGSKLHIIGLISDGGVHSHINHIKELIKIAKEENIENLYIHAILDGRDTLPNISEKYLNEISKIAKISTISGRFYAMDRENIWERTKAYYDCITKEQSKENKNYKEIIENSYKKNIYDEFIKPNIIDKNGLIEENDSIIIANFRPDRLIQLCKTFDNNFSEFKTKKFKNLKITTMMEVNSEIKYPHIFEHEIVNNTLGETLSKNNIKVLRIAEEAKYPHVTHFLDGDKDIDLKGTDKIKIPRKKVETYDLAPEMSSKEIVDEIEKRINKYEFICVNLANGDMVGHTGNLEAATKAVETLDECVNKLYNLSIKNNYTLIITADHGNCEEMIGKNNEVLTTHTTNPVNLIVCNKKYKVKNGSLSNIAPSILKIMGIKIPKEMNKQIINKKLF